MANSNAAFGLRPVMEANGSPWSGATQLFYVPSTDANAMYIGDPVIYAGSADANGVPTAALATAAGGAASVTGAIVGWVPSSTIVANGYRLASTAEYALVAMGTGLIYEVQEDAVGGALAAVDVGLNADLVSGTGSASTRLSGWQLDTSTKQTTATLQLKIKGFVQRPDNVIGANAKVLVSINTSSDSPATVGH